MFRTFRRGFLAAAAAFLLFPPPSVAQPGVICEPALAEPLPLDLRCPPAIRPGAASNVCTLNFVATDGVDLFIGAAGHCASVGRRLRVAGVPGEVGTVVYQRNQLLGGDWAFVRIDPEDRGRVDATMCRFGGPFASALGSVRNPLPGEVVLHYGHGASAGQAEETRGRVGPVVPNLFGPESFAFLSNVDGGDSGSPVRLASGEAAGIAIATLVRGYVPNLVVASRLDRALEDFSGFWGREVRVVEGRAVPDLPDVT